jgi:hypothetical protein
MAAVSISWLNPNQTALAGEVNAVNDVSVCATSCI